MLLMKCGKERRERKVKERKMKGEKKEMEIKGLERTREEDKRKGKES